MCRFPWLSPILFPFFVRCVSSFTFVSRFSSTLFLLWVQCIVNVAFAYMAMALYGRSGDVVSELLSEPSEETNGRALLHFFSVRKECQHEIRTDVAYKRCANEQQDNLGLHRTVVLFL